MEKKIKKQVSDYYRGTAEIIVYLPKEEPYCKNCILGCKYRSAYDNYYCIFTDELLLNPKKEIGAKCPFFKESE
jgi:hypothetical protein